MTYSVLLKTQHDELCFIYRTLEELLDNLEDLAGLEFETITILRGIYGD